MPVDWKPTVTNLGSAAQTGREAGKAVLDRTRKFVAGTGKGTVGATGGLLEAGNGLLNTTVNMTAEIAKSGFGLIRAMPGVAALVGFLAASFGLKKWWDGHQRNKQIQKLQEHNAKGGAETEALLKARFDALTPAQKEQLLRAENIASMAAGNNPGNKNHAADLRGGQSVANIPTFSA